MIHVRATRWIWLIARESEIKMLLNHDHHELSCRFLEDDRTHNEADQPEDAYWCRGGTCEEIWQVLRDCLSQEQTAALEKQNVSL